MATKKVSDGLSQLWRRYEDALIKDPATASKIEAGLKVLSYFILGRLGGAQEFSEFAYSFSNLFTLLNDYIITKRCLTSSPVAKLPLAHQRLLWSLGVLDCLEVIIEVFTQFLWQEAGKWMVVFSLQVLKAALRLVVVCRFRSRMLTSPPVPPVDRKKVKRLPSDVEVPPADKPVAWRGSRTGKIIRSIHSDPAIPYSQLEDLMSATSHDTMDGSGRNQSMLENREVMAEALHIARPVAHILSMFVFQQSSWKPWLIALAMDVISLHLHGGLIKFDTKAPSEVLRRRLVLLLYLLRSPFYDSYTKSIIVGLLQFVASHFPFGSWIVDPLLEYLPIWQNIYSYNWMT